MRRPYLYFLILCVFVTDRTFCGSKQRRCPGNSLNREEVLQYVATGETFLHIYSIEKDPLGETFGKSYTSFTPNEDGTISIFNYGFNESQGKCQAFPSMNQTITDRRQKRKKNGKRQPIVDSFVTLDGEIQFRLYSQSPDKYFWNHFCSDGITKTFDSCTFGFVDLLIRDRRPGMTGEIDLSLLPWHQIAEDLKFTGIKFGDPRLKFIWRGQPCSASGPF